MRINVDNFFDTLEDKKLKREFNKMLDKALKEVREQQKKGETNFAKYPKEGCTKVGMNLEKEMERQEKE